MNNIHLPGNINISQVDWNNTLTLDIVKSIIEELTDIVSNIDILNIIDGNYERISELFEWCPNHNGAGSNGYNDTSKIYLCPGENNGDIDIWAYASSWDLIHTYTLQFNYEYENVKIEDKISELNSKLSEDENEWYWCDVMREYGGPKEVSTYNYYVSKSSGTEGNIISRSGCIVVFFDVNPGEKWKLERVVSTSYAAAYVFYNATRAEMGITQQFKTLTLHSYYISGDDITTNNTETYNVEFTVPTGAKCMAITYYWTNHLGDETNIYKWTKKSNTLTDSLCKKIEKWSDDELYLNYGGGYYDNYGWNSNSQTKEYEIGDKFGTMVYSNSYGSRMARVDVKEGDVLSLDIYSPQKYSLIFTDFDYIITDIYDQRRLKGIYIAPKDGYAYIIDVLYRDNYIYSNGYKDIQKIVEDKIQQDDKNKLDLYNELAPHILESKLPLEFDFIPTQNTIDIGYNVYSANHPYNGLNVYSSITKSYKFILQMYHWHVGENNAQTKGTMMIADKNDNGVTSNAMSIAEGEGWIHKISTDTIIPIPSEGLYKYMYAAVSQGSFTVGTRIHFIIDKVFYHTFDNLQDANEVRDKIMSGEYDIDAYGVIEKPIDILDSTKSIISAQSIKDLGYDIIERGAELPIDSKGYAYGKSIKGVTISSEAIFRQYFGNDTEAKVNNGHGKEIVYIPHMNWTYPSNVTTILYAFRWMFNLETIPKDNLPYDKIIFGNFSFSSCYKLKKIHNIKTNLYYTFGDAYQLEDINSINITSPGSNTGYYAFYNCYALKRIGSIINSSYITNMSNMFSYCTSIEQIPDIDTQNVTTMTYAFQYCLSLKEPPTFTSTAKVTNFTSTFYYCKNLMTIPYFDDTSESTLFNSMFYSCYKLKNTLTNHFDATNATSIAGMFYSCTSLEVSPTIEISNKCTGIQNVYSGCHALTSAGLYGDFSAVTLSSSTYANCSNIEHIDITFNTSSCTNTSAMFQNCSKLISVGSIDTSLVEQAQYMFQNCTELISIGSNNTLDFSSINATGNAGLWYTFYSCRKLPYLNLTNTSQAKSFNVAFNRCSSLTKLEGLDFSSITSLTSTFNGCTALVEMEIANLGKSSGLASYDFTGATNWGNDNNGPGYTSLINTLTTNLWDRSSMAKGTIKLAVNSYDQLTLTEKNAIVAKNYDLYRGSTKFNGNN